MKLKNWKIPAAFTVAAVLAVSMLTGCADKSPKPKEEETVTSSVTENTDSGAPEVAEAPEAPEPTEAPEVIGLANPVQPCESLDEVNQTVGCSMVHLPVMGITDTGYATIDTGEGVVGEYRFEFLGGDWTLRAAEADHDISGVYIDGEPISQLGEVESIIGVDNYIYSCWFVDGMQYSLLCETNEAVNAEQFSSAVDELKAMSINAPV